MAWVPSVLVLHEHHGTFYMDASTEALFNVSVMKIIRGRFQSGDWYQNEEDKEFRNECSKFLRRFCAESCWELLQSRNRFADENVELVPLLSTYMKES